MNGRIGQPTVIRTPVKLEKPQSKDVRHDPNKQVAYQSKPGLLEKLRHALTRQLNGAGKDSAAHAVKTRVSRGSVLLVQNDTARKSVSFHQDLSIPIPDSIERQLTAALADLEKAVRDKPIQQMKSDQTSDQIQQNDPPQFDDILSELGVTRQPETGKTEDHSAGGSRAPTSKAAPPAPPSAHGRPPLSSTKAPPPPPPSTNGRPSLSLNYSVRPPASSYVPPPPSDAPPPPPPSDAPPPPPR